MGAGGDQRVPRPGGRRTRHQRDAGRTHAYATDWGGSSAIHSTPIPAYDPSREALTDFIANLDFGDPASAADSLLAIADTDEPPLRVFFGTQRNEMIPPLYEERLKTWAAWRELSTRAQGATTNA